MSRATQQKSVSSRGFLLAAILYGLTVPTGLEAAEITPPATAAPAPPVRTGETAKNGANALWVKVCEGNKAGKEGICYISQEQHTKEGLLHVRFAYGLLGPGKKPAILVVMPLGIQLRAGAAVIIDKSTPILLVLQYCTSQGCLGTAQLDDDQARLLLQSTDVKVVMQPADSQQTISIPIAMTGFDAATKTLASAETAAEAHPATAPAATPAPAATTVPAATPAPAQTAIPLPATPSSSVEATPQPATLYAGTRIRETPDERGQMLEMLPQTTVVTVLEKSADGAWWRLSRGGWVAARLVRFTATAPAQTPPPVATAALAETAIQSPPAPSSSVEATPQPATLYAGTRIRETPDERARMLEMLRQTTVVTVLEKSADGAWWRLSRGGWVAARLVHLKETGQP